MNELFSKENIKQVYFELKSKKQVDRQKKLPVGLDGVTSEIFERDLDFSINEIYRKLIAYNGETKYSFAPLLRIERTKAQGGIRALHIPRLRDQIVFRLIHNEIQFLAQKSSIDLKLKSPYNFVIRFDEYIKQFEKPVILKTDISQFYDSIPRDSAVSLSSTIGLRSELLHLLQEWSKNLKIRRSTLSILADTEQFSGLPQGLSISSLLAELYVKQIDQLFINDKGYFRYIDDVVIVCSNREDAKIKLEKLKIFVDKIGLRLSANKTEIVDFTSGFEWLGLYHYPDRKFMNPEKILRALKPIHSLQKTCLSQLSQCNTNIEKSILIKQFIKKVDKFITGSNKVRIRWYSLCTDNGQWRSMDKQIHGLIRSCIRKSKISESEFPMLPSIHAKILSYKKIKEVTINTD